MKLDWKYLFDKRILERGYTYYIDGNVENIKIDNGIIEAEVAGSYTYEVEIEYNGEDVMNMSCSCPHAADGFHCKHMAAVLFESNDLGEPVLKSSEDIRNIINRIPTEVIKEYLYELAIKNQKIRSDIVARFGIGERAVILKQSLKEVELLFYRYGGLANFISDRNLENFYDDLSEYMHNRVGTFIQRKEFQPAFLLNHHIYKELQLVEFESEEEELVFMIFYECENNFKYMYKQCDTINDKNWLKTQLLSLDLEDIDYLED